MFNSLQVVFECNNNSINAKYKRGSMITLMFFIILNKPRKEIND